MKNYRCFACDHEYESEEPPKLPETPTSLGHEVLTDTEVISTAGVCPKCGVDAVAEFRHLDDLTGDFVRHYEKHYKRFGVALIALEKSTRKAHVITAFEQEHYDDMAKSVLIQGFVMMGLDKHYTEALWKCTPDELRETILENFRD